MTPNTISHKNSDQLQSFNSRKGPYIPGRPPGRSSGRNAIIVILSVVLLGALIFAVVRLSMVAGTSNDQLLLRVNNQQAATIDLRQNFPISPYLLGTNVFPKVNSNSVNKQSSGFMEYTPQLINDLKSMRIKLLRYPGGDWGEENILSFEQLRDFADILSQTKADGMVQAHLNGPVLDLGGNMSSDLGVRADLAGRWVDFMNNEKSTWRTGALKDTPLYPAKFWTVGNEPNRSVNPLTDNTYTVDEYVEAFIQYSIAMHQSDPTIKIFGPEISTFFGVDSGPFDNQGKAWMDDFLEGVATYERQHPEIPYRLLDGVSFHLYQVDDAREAATKLLGSTNEWEYLLTPLREKIKQQFGRDIPVAVTEINTNPGREVPARGLAALWWADTLGMLMNKQVDYVAFFSAAAVERPYPLFSQNGQQETVMARVMELFSHLQTNLTPLSIDHDPVSIYATQDTDHQKVSLLMINKSATTQLIQVESANQIFQVSPWRNMSVSLAPYSIVVLTLNRGGSADALSFVVPPNDNTPVPALKSTQCGNKTDPLAHNVPC